MTESSKNALPVQVVIMAAGMGTRMRSKTPKVLHKLGGRALLGHVLSTAANLGAQQAVVIVGHEAPKVIAYLQANTPTCATFSTQTALQSPQLGTGHAVQQAVPHLGDEGVVVVLSGDVPLIEAATVQSLIERCAGTHLALLTVDTGADARSYGRIVRSASGDVQKIVEFKDASPEQRAITEWYSGIMAAPAKAFKHWLSQLTNDNAAREYYLTDVVAIAVATGTRVQGVVTADEWQVQGINQPSELAAMERQYQGVQAQALLKQGIRLADAQRIDVRGELICAPNSKTPDIEIDVGCVFEGRVVLGEDVKIGAHCVIANCEIASGAQIAPFTHIDGGKDGVVVGEGALIGPFARLRPGAKLGAQVHIGNFVEVKNSTLAAGAKANHLAYLGDAQVGERVNYGAGAITANYDGANKHTTVIEADVHVGSNCVLVAPVTLGAGATIGGGSTINKSVPAGSLAVARAKPVLIDGWKRPTKQQPKG